ncbi:flagellin N-terminal helical domain-containing protein [Belnapia moabensis]|uniref:flagellin N-terminal helical domain-containing protein n=1 Tax=Belnapia moabensis TaxID=365533 RepID=UPI0005B9456B|nr:flagellin [Belnapia moabensis]
MASSILTNTGAMTALQSLQMTQKSLLETQNRISTGLKVASAKDNAATWAVATTMRADIGNFKQVSENLSTAASIVGTARSGAEQLADLAKQIKEKVTSAQDPSKNKAQIQGDIDQLIAQMKSTIDASSYNSVNMLNSLGQQRVVASVNNVGGVSTPTYIDVKNQDLRVEQGAGLASLQDLSVLSKADTILANATDAEKTIDYSFTGGGTPGTNDDNGGQVIFSYTDAEGKARSIVTSFATTDITDDLIAAKVAANTSFDAAGFKVTSASGVLTVSAKNREVGVSFNKDAFFVQNNTGGDYATTGGSDKVSMTFNANKPLALGDLMQLSYTNTGTSAVTTAKFQVANATSGTILNTDSNGVNTYALNAAVVSDYNVSGGSPGMRAEFATALTAAMGGGFTVGVSGSTVTLTAAASHTLSDFRFPPTDYAALLAKADAAMSVTTNAAAALGSAGARIDTQKSFMDKLVDTLTTGVGALVDADMSAEAARLQALQVQQQLGTQALSIANQAPQSILSLFQ